MWAVSSGLIACNCHILVAEQNVSSAQKIQAEVAHELEHSFKISHATIQIEAEDCGGHDHTAQTNDEHKHEHAH